MPPSEEAIISLLKATFDGNYNPELSQNKDERPEGTIPSPIQFYDRHISSNHILKKVVYLRSIPRLLSKVCDDGIQDLLASEHPVSSKSYKFKIDLPNVNIANARDVATYYTSYVGNVGIGYSSKLCIHPHLDTWRSVFNFVPELPTDPFYLAETFLSLRTKATKIFFPDPLGKELSKPTKDTLTDLFDKFPRLAMWHMYPMIDTFTTIFHSVTNDVDFSWDTAHTKGYTVTTHNALPPDALTLARKLRAQASSRKRKSDRPALDRKRIIKAKKIVTPSQTPERMLYRPDLRHYLQDAWAKAAIYDTTYIILNCGRYERIGIRHRASQTLYLSGVIDTINTKDPHYRKLHIGLHIAIVQDALERKKLADALAEKSKSGYNIAKKRSSDSLEDKETSKSKRQRPSKSPSGYEGTKTHNTIVKELVRRKLALVTIDYDAFCSPIPSSFVRIGESCMRDMSMEDTDWSEDPYRQKIYNGEEYFTLKLQAPLGNGAVGVVHPAQAELTLESGEVLRANLVFKIAFNEKQQTKMKNEFNTYCRLSRADGVEGIVDVHGLFHDIESGVMGILMADGGKTLRQREAERAGKFAEQVTTNEREREAFINALNSLHRAKVRHRDIRADNLLINSEGQVFIIDFDCADSTVYETQRTEELRCLNDVLRGEYPQGAYYSIQ